MVTIEVFANTLSELPSITNTYIGVVGDCLKCRFGRPLIVKRPGAAEGLEPVHHGAVFQIYTYCDARARKLDGCAYKGNTEPSRWGFLDPGTGFTYNASVIAVLVIAIGLKEDIRTLTGDAARSAMIRNLILAVQTGGEFGLRAVTLFAFLGGLSTYNDEECVALEEEILHASGVTLGDCVSLCAVCVMERTAAPFLEPLLDNGDNEIDLLQEYSVGTAAITVREWKFGIGVHHTGHDFLVKYIEVNGVRVFPSKFARNIAILHSRGIIIPGETAIEKVRDLLVWPVDDLYCSSGVGYYSLRDTPHRDEPVSGPMEAVMPASSLRIDENFVLQRYNFRAQMTTSMVILALIALPTWAMVDVGPSDGAAYGVILGGLVLAFAATQSDRSGWWRLCLDGYQKLGNGIGVVGVDAAEVVAECYRSGICPFSEHTCWFNGPSAGPLGLPSEGLRISRLNIEREAFSTLVSRLVHALVRALGFRSLQPEVHRTREYHRGLLANVRHGCNVQDVQFPLFMVEGVTEGRAYGSFRRKTAWPFDTPVVVIGGHTHPAKRPDTLRLDHCPDSQSIINRARCKVTGLYRNMALTSDKGVGDAPVWRSTTRCHEGPGTALTLGSAMLLPLSKPVSSQEIVQEEGGAVDDPDVTEVPTTGPLAITGGSTVESGGGNISLAQTRTRRRHHRGHEGQWAYTSSNKRPSRSVAVRNARAPNRASSRRANVLGRAGKRVLGYRGMSRRPIEDPASVGRDTKLLVVRYRLSKRETDRSELGWPTMCGATTSTVRGRKEITIAVRPGSFDVNKPRRGYKLISAIHMEPHEWYCRTTTMCTDSTSTHNINVAHSRLSSLKQAIAYRALGNTMGLRQLTLSGDAEFPPDPRKFWSDEDYMRAATLAGWRQDTSGISIMLPQGNFITLTSLTTPAAAEPFGGAAYE